MHAFSCASGLADIHRIDGPPSCEANSLFKLFNARQERAGPSQRERDRKREGYRASVKEGRREERSTKIDGATSSVTK